MGTGVGGQVVVNIVLSMFCPGVTRPSDLPGAARRCLLGAITLALALRFRGLRLGLQPYPFTAVR